MKTILFLGLLFGSTAFAGGVSGGGGNSKPTNQINNLDFIVAKSEAKKYAALYLNNLEEMRIYSALWPNHTDLPAKLYDGESSVVQEIVNIPITVQEQGPCIDPVTRQEMDGSATLNPPVICISKPRLMEKLSQEDVRNQIIALIVHEYSHLVGATEQEADFLQRKALHDLINAEFFNINNRFKKAEESINLIKVLGMPDLWDGETIDQKFWAQTAESLAGIQQNFEKDVASPAPSVLHFSLWDSRTRNLFSRTSLRLELMEQGMCELARGKDWRKCQAAQNKIFQRDREIDYHTYMVRTGHKPGEFVEIPGLVFRRILSIEDANAEHPRLNAESDLYFNYVQVLQDYVNGELR